MNSEERRAARRKRRDEERAAKRAERVEGCTLEAVADINALYDAARQCARGVGWKSSTIRYMDDVVPNILKARRDLLSGADFHRGFVRFDLMERGKLRHISSVHFPERVIQKSFAQNALVPALSPSLIYDNSANLKGKGTDFAIRRMKLHLAEHYRKSGCDGYILLGDFSDFFARIAHEPIKHQAASALADKRLVELDGRMVDLQGDVGLGLGSEPNQIHAVAYPSPLDHYVTEMLGVEAYGRYMDDFYAIHDSKDYLQVVLMLVERKCAALGITLNAKKTRVVKLSRGFVYLKKRFSYGENGRVVVRPSRAQVTRERRKLKRQAVLVRRGEMTYGQVLQSYQSWRGSMKRLDAHRTLLSMDALFWELFGYLAVNEDPPRERFEHIDSC